MECSLFDNKHTPTQITRTVFLAVIGNRFILFFRSLFHID